MGFTFLRRRQNTWSLADRLMRPYLVQRLPGSHDTARQRHVRRGRVAGHSTKPTVELGYRKDRRSSLRGPGKRRKSLSLHTALRKVNNAVLSLEERPLVWNFFRSIGCTHSPTNSHRADRRTCITCNVSGTAPPVASSKSHG